MRGASWEGFVIEQIIALLPDWQPFFYRTSNGAEFDLVLVNGDDLWAFEVKASSSPQITKGFHTAREDLKPRQTFIISRAEGTWTNRDGVTYTCLQDLPSILNDL